MHYVKNQIEANIDIPGAFSKHLNVIDLDVPRVGGGNGVAILATSGKADFDDSFQLAYTVGWGDCPAGCIYRHNWLIEVTPKKIENRYAFDVEILEESGSPLVDN